MSKDLKSDSSSCLSHGYYTSAYGKSTKISDTSFPGSSRYVYYDKNHVKRYFYSSDDPALIYKAKWWMLLVYIPFIALFLYLIVSAVYLPQKLQNSDSVILVEDKIGIIDDISALKSALLRFYEETGVTPAVLTVYDDEWSDSYTGITSYTQNQYTIRFRDGKHWLILYTAPRNPSGSDFGNWRVDNLPGEECSAVISDNVRSAFYERLLSYLKAENRYNIGEAISLAFTDTIPDTKKPVISWGKLLGGLLGLAFVIVHGVLMIGLLPAHRRLAKAKLAPENKDLSVTCKYCGSTFILGDHTNCPNCGAELKAASAAAPPLA